MTEKLPQDLREMIADGRIEINVRETPWGDKEMMVSDNTSDKYSISSELFDKLYDFLENRKELVLKIDEVESNKEGIDEFWHLGRLANEYVGNGELSNGEFSLLSGSADEGTFVGQMRSINDTFPNQDYSNKHFNPSTMAELMQIDGLDADDVRQLNEKTKEMDVYVDKKKMRTIRYILRRDSLEATVNECMDKKIYKEMTVGESINTINVTHDIMGIEVDKDEVEKLVKESMVN